MAVNEATDMVVTLPDGFNWPKNRFPQNNYYDLINLKLVESDIIVSTFPKCGTNWVAYIIWEILHKGEAIAQDFVSLFPLVDCSGIETFLRQSHPRKLYTHIPVGRLPLQAGARYICVFRNPFDCFVSYYEFLKRKIPDPERCVNFRFDDFFEVFVSGGTAFGDFFEHALAWYAKREEPNVLCLSFEDMKANHKDNVRKIAAFLGEPETILNDDVIIDKIVEKSTFRSMNENLNFGMVTGAPTPRKFEMLRKGQVGDFKNYLSDQQKNRIAKKMREKMAGTDLLEIWEKVIS